MDQIMKIIKILSGILVELLPIIIFIWGVFQVRLKKKVIPYALAVILLVLTCCFVVLSRSEANIPPISLVIQLLIVIICFYETYYKKILLYFITYLILYVFSSFFTTLLVACTRLQEEFLLETTRGRFIVFGSVFLCFFLIALFIKGSKSNVATKIREMSFRYYVYTIPGLLGCALALGFIRVGRKDVLNSAFDKIAIVSLSLISITFIIGTILLVVIDNSRHHYRIENELKEKYLSVQQNYYTKVIERDAEIRHLYHDIKSHMGCISLLAEGKKYDELAQYITQVTDNINGIYKNSINVGNDVVNALLNYFSQEAENGSVQLKVQGNICNELKILGVDLSTLLANALKNAIEECSQMDDVEKRIVSVKIAKKKNNIVFLIENPIREAVNIKLLGQYTSKHDKKNHGIGIQNMNEVIKKYNGTIDYVCDKDKFKVEIVLFDVI